MNFTKLLALFLPSLELWFRPSGPFLNAKMQKTFCLEYDNFGLQFQGIEELNGVRCTKWVAEINMLNRTDTYTFHASDDADPKPIRFEMEGYDILLTSYYDHYIVDYKEFSQWEYDPSVFDIPEGKYFHTNFLFSVSSCNLARSTGFSNKIISPSSLPNFLCS